MKIRKWEKFASVTRIPDLCWMLNYNFRERRRHQSGVRQINIVVTLQCDDQCRQWVVTTQQYQPGPAEQCRAVAATVVLQRVIIVQARLAAQHPRLQLCPLTTLSHTPLWSPVLASVWESRVGVSVVCGQCGQFVLLGSSSVTPWVWRVENTESWEKTLISSSSQHTRLVNYCKHSSPSHRYLPLSQCVIAAPVLLLLVHGWLIDNCRQSINYQLHLNNSCNSVSGEK